MRPPGPVWRRFSRRRAELPLRGLPRPADSGRASSAHSPNARASLWPELERLASPRCDRASGDTTGRPPSLPTAYNPPESLWRGNEPLSNQTVSFITACSHWKARSNGMSFG